MSLVTITRNIGCGGTTIARLVADGLKLELYDDHRLQEEAIKMGISPEVLKRLDEKAPGLFNRLLSHKPETYLDLWRQWSTRWPIEVKESSWDTAARCFSGISDAPCTCAFTPQSPSVSSISCISKA